MLTEKQPTNCQNCGKAISENYCDKCGQARLVGRLSLKTLLRDILFIGLDLDIPLLSTIRKLVTAPGAFCYEYIEGKRQTKYNPVKFYLLAITLYFALYFGLDMMEETQQLVNQWRDSFAASPYSENQHFKTFDTIIFENSKYFSMFLIPVFAFFNKWFFKKTNLNYAEHLVFVLYTQGMVSLLGILNCFIFQVYPNIFMYMGFISVAYVIYASLSFFKGAKISIIVKSIIIQMLAYVILILFTSPLVFLYIYLLSR